jgi:hypothetical protein
VSSDEPKPRSIAPPNNGQAKEAPFEWKSLPTELLIQFHDEIRACLPPLSLTQMNLEEELLLQYHSLRSLQTLVLNDDTLPLNQRAQVANSVVATLDRLVGAQEKVYSQERFKAIETALIRHLKRLPEATAEAFLVDYKAILLAQK